MKIEYFYLEEGLANRFLLKFHPELLPFTGQIQGAPAVLPSRILGLDYVSYLRYARDVLGAEVIGRNHLYPIVYYEKTPAVMQLVKLLNSRMELILMEYERPYDFIKDENGNLIKVDFDGNILGEVNYVDDGNPPWAVEDQTSKTDAEV